MFEFLTLGKNSKESQWTEISRFFMIEETMYFCMMNLLPLRCGVQWSQTQTYNCIQVNPVRYCREPVMEQNSFWWPSCMAFFLEFGMMVVTTNGFVRWNKNGLKCHICFFSHHQDGVFSKQTATRHVFPMFDHDWPWHKNAGLTARKELRIWKLWGWNTKMVQFQSHTIHVWYIYPHLPYFTIKKTTKCR